MGRTGEILYPFLIKSLIPIIKPCEYLPKNLTVLILYDSNFVPSVAGY